MPIYDFQCSFEECEHIFEELVPIGKDCIKCPKCDWVAFRLVSAPHIGGVAAQRIRDAALRNNYSGPVSVSVPKTYKNKKKKNEPSGSSS